jgi:hypothetical protein
VRRGVREAQFGQPVTVLTLRAASQRALAGGQADRPAAQLGQDPVSVRQAGRLDHPGDHQIPEHLIGERVETEARVHPGEGVEQHRRTRPQHPGTRHHLPRQRRRLLREQRCLPRRREHRRLASRRGQPEIENALTLIGQQPVRPLNQQPELGLITRRPDMTHDPAPATNRLSDLHSRRPRRRPNPPDPRHRAESKSQN